MEYGQGLVLGGSGVACTNLVWAGIQKGRKFQMLRKKTNPTEEQDFRFSWKIINEKSFLAGSQAGRLARSLVHVPDALYFCNLALFKVYIKTLSGKNV